MKFSKKFKENILNKSDNYNFFKKEYEKLKKNEIDLKKENIKLKRTIKFYENNGGDCETFNDFLIKSYHTPFFNAPFSSNQKRCFEFMDVVADYLIKNVDELDNKPLVSVIMPVYNRKDVVLDSIDSVLSQTYENFELIIVDDASDDGTRELLKEINNDKIRVIFHENNQDASAARNTALKEVKGEYIAYLDSDNLFEKNYLKASIGAFLEFPDAGAIYSAQKRYDFHDSELSQVLFGHLNKSSLFNQNSIDINCFVHKKEIIDEIGYFDEKLPIGEDWDFILRIIHHYKIYSVPFMLSNYYLKVADNRKLITTHSNREKNYKNNEKLMITYPNLSKKVKIVIPVSENHDNLDRCIDSIFSLGLDNVNITVLNSSLDFNNENIIETNPNLSFSDDFINIIKDYDDDSDLILLNQNAILTSGNIELMQKYAYELSDCGLIVPNQLIKDSPLIKKYSPHVHEDYWFDINTYDNIVEMPLFFDGEKLELKYSPFFCTYLKNEVLENIHTIDFNLKDNNNFMHDLSDYIRKVLNLKIYYVSNINVYRNKH